MTRTGGTRLARSLRLLVPGALLLAGALAACSSAADTVKDAAISKLAIGTWACDAGPEEQPFHIQIRDGAFTVSPDNTTETRKLTGTWVVEDGDLTIAFTGLAVGAPELKVLGFEDLTPDSTRLTLDDNGLVGRPMAETEADPSAATEPLDMEVEAKGTDAVTLTAPEGRPWTCTRDED